MTDENNNNPQPTERGSEIDRVEAREQQVGIMRTLLYRALILLVSAARTEDKTEREALTREAAGALAEVIVSALETKNKTDTAQTKDIRSIFEQLKTTNGYVSVGTTIIINALLKILEKFGVSP